MAQQPSHAFTTTGIGGLLNQLKNQCRISAFFDPAAGGLQPPIADFDAIWDTGATNSVITQAVVDACGLQPMGIIQTHGVHGTQDSEQFLVNIYLPNAVAFGGVVVTKGQLTAGAEILIGMDIINRGDFAVTNHGGITKFSFRVPSAKHIDFVEEINARAQRSSHGGTKKERKRQPKTYGKNKKRKRKR